MILAIASGKGGTGKTTVSASLASVWPSPVVAVDLDVEEPNLHLFLKPAIDNQVASTIAVPEIQDDRCTRCRICTDICQFKAIGIFGDVVMTFPEMCHGCGACWTLCPEKAITPAKRPLGQILSGRSDLGEFIMGRLRIGEAAAQLGTSQSSLNRKLAIAHKRLHALRFAERDHLVHIFGWNGEDHSLLGFRDPDFCVGFSI